MKKVACFGSGSGIPGEWAYDNMQEVGRLIALSGLYVVTGGYGGSGMEAPVKGAKEVGGHTIGYTLKYSRKKPNQYLDEVIVCGKDILVEPNTDAIQYSLRLGFLLQADGFIIDPTDKTPGTFIEFLSVANLNEKFWADNPKPVVLLSGTQQAIYFIKNVKSSERYTLITRAPSTATDWIIEKISA